MAKKKITEELPEKNEIEAQEFTSLMEKSYIDYALSVIIDRALPDIRDGLKPVQRRTLYDMLDLGITHDKPYRKSARIVGDTMGRFHAHGDSSIYGTIVNMAIPWKNNVALVDGHGNFGSVDGDGAAAMRYCVAGNTLINTDMGLIPIKNICENNENSDNNIDINIQSYNVQNHSDMLFNSGKHPIKEVVLKNGMKLKGSYNHPILVLQNNNEALPSFTWKTLDKLNKDDIVVVARNYDIESKTDLCTIEEARMLGLLVSEGYINESNNRIGFVNKDIDLVNFMKLNMSKYFHANICENIRDEYYDICIHNKSEFNNFVLKYDFKKNSKNKIVPSLILGSTLKIQAEFLKYLYEGDGSVSFISDNRKSSKLMIISYFSSSINLVETLQIMLLQFGIYSSITKNKNGFKLNINGEENVLLFYNKIGFVSKRKYDVLKECADYALIVSSFETYGYDKIPFLDNYMKLNYPSRIYKLGYENKKRFLKNKNRFEANLKEEDFRFLSNLYDYNFLYLPIKEINNLPEDVVYSIRVNSECHSFIGNGFINHNTEARLSKMGELMMEDMSDRIVPYRDNFDATDKEPEVLPAKFPQLFVNGCEGIAVGIKTYIPPHNLAELIDAAILLIQKPKSTIADLMKFVKGPDYPTGGSVINKNELLNLYQTGVGKVVIRGKTKTEPLTGGRTNLVITEIPYTMSGNKTLLVNSIVELIKNGKLNEVSEVRDESDENVRIVLEVKKGQDADKVLNKLYKKTKLQDNDSCSFWVIHGVQPKIVNLKEYLNAFLEFQDEITTNKYQLLLEKAQNRLEVVEGLLKANDLIDPIIETIRFAKNISVAKNCLITGDTADINYRTKKMEVMAKKFDFTENQAQVIVDMRLSRLNNLEITGYEKEKNDLIKKIASYQKILASKNLLHKEIIKYLTEIKESYGVRRKTSITNSEVNVIVEEEAPIEEAVQILIDRFGYLKVVDSVSVSRSSDETLGTFKHNISATNTDKLAVFTDKGNIYQLKLIDLPKLKMKDKGQPIDVLCGFKEKEEILLLAPMNEVTSGHIIFVFNDGYVKNVPGSEYITRQKLTVATKLYDNNIFSILLNKDKKNLIVATEKKKQTIDLTSQTEHKKTVKGNKWIKKRDTDSIKSVELK